MNLSPQQIDRFVKHDDVVLECKQHGYQKVVSCAGPESLSKLFPL